MCGRYSLSRPKLALEVYAADQELPLPARYNIAPGQEVACVRAGEGGSRRAALLRWGLVPAWAEDPSIGDRMINARAETVAQRPAFRRAFRSRRCLVLADGFYEWQRLGRRKQPFYFFMEPDRRPFALAGLWERWEGPSGQRIESCTILTTEANELVARVHGRMPVVVAPEQAGLWLAPDAPGSALKELLVPYPAEAIGCHPVTTYVNNPANEGPRCVEPVPRPPPRS